MDPLGAGVLPVESRLDRVAEPLLGAGDTLHQLDRLPVGNVHGREELERHVERR